jgi:dTDP-4-amino-4,6-dideoxygalactose transaminase
MSLKQKALSGIFWSSIESGALVCRDAETKKRIDYLKNFGFAGETTVVAPGTTEKWTKSTLLTDFCL